MYYAYISTINIEYIYIGDDNITHLNPNLSFLICGGTLFLQQCFWVIFKGIYCAGIVSSLFLARAVCFPLTLYVLSFVLKEILFGEIRIEA